MEAKQVRPRKSVTKNGDRSKSEKKKKKVPVIERKERLAATCSGLVVGAAIGLALQIYILTSSPSGIYLYPLVCGGLTSIAMYQICRPGSKVAIYIGKPSLFVYSHIFNLLKKINIIRDFLFTTETVAINIDNTVQHVKNMPKTVKKSLVRAFDSHTASIRTQASSVIRAIDESSAIVREHASTIVQSTKSSLVGGAASIVEGAGIMVDDVTATVRHRALSTATNLVEGVNRTALEAMDKVQRHVESGLKDIQAMAAVHTSRFHTIMVPAASTPAVTAVTQNCHNLIRNCNP